jgi:NitT/TauT family transport system substrate-binding protein
VLNIVESGDTIHSIADLKGKTVYLTGKGASPEYVMDYLLTQAGLTPGVDVDLQFLTEHTEVVAKLTSTPGAIGVLPQPFVTIAEAKSPDLRTALDMTAEWAKVSPDSELITGVVVVRNSFATEHPDAVAQFMKDYAASTQWVNAKPADAAPLIVAAGIVPDATLAEKAIPLCYITFVAGADMKSSLSGYLQVLFNADPKSVGGSMPGDDFYFAG